jgi:hypothetical protein
MPVPSRSCSSSDWLSRARCRGDGSDERAREFRGVAERHHVPGSLDYGVLDARNVPQHHITDGMVKGGGRRPLDDVHRHRHPHECFNRQRRIEEHVPKVSSSALLVEKRLSAVGWPKRERPGSVVEVHELLEGVVPAISTHVLTPAVAQCGDLGEACACSFLSSE